MSDGTDSTPTPQPGIDAPTQAPAIHDAPVAPAAPTTLPAVPAETATAAPLTAKEQAVADSQAQVDSSAARLAEIKAKVAEGLAKEEAEHQKLVDAHAELTKPEPRDRSKVIGVDYGANGSYTYIAMPDGEPRQRQYLHGGFNFEHVAEDADGVWLYRRM